MTAQQEFVGLNDRTEKMNSSESFPAGEQVGLIETEERVRHFVSAPALAAESDRSSSGRRKRVITWRERISDVVWVAR